MAACSSCCGGDEARAGQAAMAAERKMLVWITASLTALARRCPYPVQGRDRSR
jgi:hypothetical protein